MIYHSDFSVFRFPFSSFDNLESFLRLLSCFPLFIRCCARLETAKSLLPHFFTINSRGKNRNRFRVMQWMGGRGSTEKIPKVREGKYFKVDASFTTRSVFSVCVGLRESKNASFVRRKSWLRWKKSGNKYSLWGLSWAKRMFSFRCFPTFLLSLRDWGLLLTAAGWLFMYLYVINMSRAWNEKKERKKVIIIKIPREKRLSEEEEGKCWSKKVLFPIS